MDFVNIANVILDRDKVVLLIQDPDGAHKVTVYLITGEHIEFKGREAAEVWKAFDENDWRDSA